MPFSPAFSAAVVVKVFELLLEAHMGDHEIEMAVIVEVLENDATGTPEDREPARGGDVAELADIVVGGKRFRRDQPLLWDTVRVLAQHHVRDVEEPPVDECVLGIGFWIGKEFAVAFGRFRRTELLLVHAFRLHRKDARVGVVVPRAVAQFAKSKVGKRKIRLQRFDIARRQRWAILGEQCLEAGNRRFRNAAGDVLLRQLAAQDETFDGIRLGPEVGPQARDLLFLQVPRVVPRALALRNDSERLDHVELLTRPRPRDSRDDGDGEAGDDEPDRRWCRESACGG